jgi:hypothetical protein
MASKILYFNNIFRAYAFVYLKLITKPIGIKYMYVCRYAIAILWFHYKSFSFVVYERTRVICSSGRCDDHCATLTKLLAWDSYSGSAKYIYIYIYIYNNTCHTHSNAGCLGQMPSFLFCNTQTLQIKSIMYLNTSALLRFPYKTLLPGGIRTRVSSS